MFTMKFNTSNAAFESETIHEIANILQNVARSVNTGYLEGKIRDSNGNHIGEYRYEIR